MMHMGQRSRVLRDWVDRAREALSDSRVMYGRRSESARVPIDSLALPVGLLQAVEGCLRVCSASRALLALVGAADDAASFGFAPLTGSLASTLDALGSGQAEVLIEVVAVDAPRAPRGRLALRRADELHVVGVWIEREHDWRF